MTDCTMNNVFWGHSDGILLLNTEYLLWRSRSTEAQKRLKKEDILKMTYLIFGTHYHLKIYSNNNLHVRFSNLKRKEIDEIKEYVKLNYNKEIKEETMCCNGGNWGELEFHGSSLSFVVNDEKNDDENNESNENIHINNNSKKTALDIPLELVSQCALPGKNEIELQFHEDDTVAGDEETLAEMRVYIPNNAETDDNDESSNGLNNAEQLKSKILEKANISTVTGKCIVELDETIGTFITPRGRYVIELYNTFLRMHGKTYDYKIMYSNINRCFLLEKPDKISYAFIISLEEPIRQGKQGYPHLVLQLKIEEIHINVNLTKEKLVEYNGNIHERMYGSLPQLVATLFKFIIGKKVYTSGKFFTFSNNKCVKCALKAQEGLLYPLEKSFMFIHKPTTFIRYDDINYIEFQRYDGKTGGAASRNFDLLVSCNNNVASMNVNELSKEYLFAAIDRREFPELSQFLASKKIKIRHLKEDRDNLLGDMTSGSKNKEEGEVYGSDEDEDSDFNEGDDNGSSGNEDYSDESLSGSEVENSDNDDSESNKKKSIKKKRKSETHQEPKKKTKKEVLKSDDEVL